VQRKLNREEAKAQSAFIIWLIFSLFAAQFKKTRLQSGAMQIPISKRTAKHLAHVLLMLILMVLSGCDGAMASPTPTVIVATLLPTRPPITPTPLPTAAPLPPKLIFLNPTLPEDLKQVLRSVIEPLQVEGPPVQIVDAAPAGLSADAEVTLLKPEQGPALITRTYVLAMPFPTVADNISTDQLNDFWHGNLDGLDALSGGISMTLFTDQQSLQAMEAMLGPANPQLPISVVEPQDLISQTWSVRPTGIALLPFDALEARWKMLHVNDINLFEREANAAAYPLSLRVGVIGESATAQAVRQAISQGVTPLDNRDLSKMAIVAMTGVTAMVRGTAIKMEEKGITYPAEAIVDWLRTADVTHISNEVSFWDQCPPPTIYDGTVMCSNPKYIDLLKYVGTDVIELTGNHLWDRGAWNLSDTIKMYEDLGWGVFGGGRNLADSLRPFTTTVNGNRIAFVGCNWFGQDWAADDYPGSAPCGSANPQDFDYILPEITKLRDEGYLVIATLQYAEFYYYETNIQQGIDFDRLRAAGAIVVNGSQGHHAQGFNVDENGFIHYGTGNLFFGDQNPVGTHQTFVDRHVFYDGHYLGVDLRSAFIEDESKPVPMTPEARADLLNTLFKASGY